MFEVKTVVEINAAGRRIRAERSEQKPNSLLRSNDSLRVAIATAAEGAIRSAVTNFRAGSPDSPRVTLVGSRSMNPNVGRYDFRLSDGSPFACYVAYSTRAVKGLGDPIPPADLAEVCRLLQEDFERSDRETVRSLPAERLP